MEKNFIKLLASIITMILLVSYINSGIMEETKHPFLDASILFYLIFSGGLWLGDGLKIFFKPLEPMSYVVRKHDGKIYLFKGVISNFVPDYGIFEDEENRKEFRIQLKEFRICSEKEVFDYFWKQKYGDEK